MSDLHSISFYFTLLVNAVYFCLAAFGSAGVTELLFFSLGLDDPEYGVKAGRIFSFIGKYWPLKCAYCFNFWVSVGYFAVIYCLAGWNEYALITVPVFAGISHIVLKFAKSLY